MTERIRRRFRDEGKRSGLEMTMPTDPVPPKPQSYS